MSDHTTSTTVRNWGTAPDGQPLFLYELTGPGGLHAQLTNYGAILVSLHAPDRDGRPADIVLGHDCPEPYFQMETSPYFGATIGRSGNRIRDGRFTLDGQTYALARNNGSNALHGGPTGFHTRVWSGRVLDGEEAAVQFSYLSPDGEEGYPGQLQVQVTYTLTGAGALQIDYAATTDAPTVVNITNHTYWNLTGAVRDVLDHELTIHAQAITPVDPGLIPTGERLPVQGTPLDFRSPRRVGERVDAEHEQLRHAGGYDHNYVLDGEDLRSVAELHDPATGRTLEVLTTEPGMQFYSGNFLDGSIRGRGGQVYGHRWAVCLETQHFPDSPNQPGFPSTVLRPGETFRSRTVYRPGVR